MKINENEKNNKNKIKEVLQHSSLKNNQTLLANNAGR